MHERGLDEEGAEGPDREAGRSLGGTGTHHRASYSDPTPAAGEALARESDIDEATGRHTPGPGSPEWMCQPVDQTGFGAHVAEDASSRRTTFRDVGTGAEHAAPDRETLRSKGGDGDPSVG